MSCALPHHTSPQLSIPHHTLSYHTPCLIAAGVPGARGWVGHTAPFYPSPPSRLFHTWIHSNRTTPSACLVLLLNVGVEEINLSGRGCPRKLPDWFLKQQLSGIIKCDYHFVAGIFRGQCDDDHGPMGFALMGTQRVLTYPYSVFAKSKYEWEYH